MDIGIALAIALLCTLGTALVVLRVDLNSLPAQLLQPRAPKAGKTLLLERWQWLWHRLSFNHKITLRNLFRYKQRLLMTVLGIGSIHLDGHWYRLSHCVVVHVGDGTG
ncbi:hypothetical protein WP50_06675 [Lactiplantibacillus plantarum]|nr:hypothetical protein WP50_06675 [Lactiplantibacillus plantarum]